MNQHFSDIDSLILLHLQGELTQSDLLRLESWKNADPANRQLFDALINTENIEKELHRLRTVDVNAALERYKLIHPPSNTLIPITAARSLRKWGMVAASILLMLGVGVYIWMGSKNKIEFITTPVLAEQILPGKEGAILTLADGSQIVLDSLGNGVIATENGAELELRNGQLAYTAPSLVSDETGNTQWNTLTTPKGRQFTLQLPDGSKVWLNAASSISFPVVFNKRERKVTITGEAYFEVVAKRAANSQQQATKIPFIVTTKHQTIEVLGTHFNVNAYEDEVVERTTLLEGSVRVGPIAKVSGIILKPGQQAVLTQSSELTTHSPVALDQVMAWKNGTFNFVNTDLESVMRQLARWYNIDVVYEGRIPDKKFWGEMGRDLTLNDVLEFLKKSQVKFHLEKDRKLIVYSNGNT